MLNSSHFYFLFNFSEKEWLMNGHLKKDTEFLSQLWAELFPFIKDGKYLELGCGTGISTLFIYKFSDKKIIPFGIDHNPKAIALAKKNNPLFKNNFSCTDYFLLKPNNLQGFSTILLFCSAGEDSWYRAAEFILPLISQKRHPQIIIFSYDHNLLKPSEYIKNILKRFKKANNQIEIKSKFMIIP